MLASRSPRPREMAWGGRSHEISGNTTIPVATTHFVRALEGAQTSLQQEGIARGRQPHLCLDPDLPFVSRHSLNIAQFGNSAERITVLNMILRLPLCAQFQTDAVNAFNPHTIAIKDGW